MAKRVRDTVMTILDPHRFPWMVKPRRTNGPAAKAFEIEQAVIASAVLAAAREVETHRRTTSKDGQEQAVKDLLTSIKFKEVAVRDIPMLTAAPKPGEFCGETRLAGTLADIVARLHDGRVMAIECNGGELHCYGINSWIFAHNSRLLCFSLVRDGTRGYDAHKI